ncbi:hypothetical protein, partial [Sphingomonas sp. GB1N7]|uniref:hypothetical protein n=1 Tax=Parasphingomonas caseinilytica TaxID=3096158 RepID=UPI002FCB13BD
MIASCVVIKAAHTLRPTVASKMLYLLLPIDRQISGKRQSLGIDCRDLATSQRVIDDGRREERQPDDAS